MPEALTTSRLPPAHRRPLLLVTLAIALGIIADRVYGGLNIEQGLHIWWTASAACLLLALLSKNVRCSAILLLVASTCLGGSWHHLHWHYFEQDHLARFATAAPQPVCLQAIAIDRLKWTPAPPSNPLRAFSIGPSSELQIRVTRLRDGHEWQDVSGTCKLRINGELRDVMAGDELQIFALIDRIPPAMNPGQYDWSSAERGAGRLCDLYCKSPECVSVTKASDNWSATHWPQKVGERFQRRLATYVRPAQSDLAQAILLGSRERLQQTDRQAFLKTGTIHLLVVSGLHVGLLALAIWTVVSSGFLSRQTGLVLTACLVVGYALVTGSRPPVVRASVLIVMTLGSFAIGRRVSPTNLLATAALVVLAINPSELFRPGTQLSFLCVATLGVYGRILHNQTPFDPLTRLIHDTQPIHRKAMRRATKSTWRTATASLAVWLIVAPLVSYYFHITSPISIFITPLLLPLVSIAMFSGLAICLVAWFAPPVAWLLGEICSLCLSSTTSIVETAQHIPGSGIYLPGPTGLWIAIFYAGLLTATLTLGTRVRWTAVVSAAAVWIAIGLAAASWKSQDAKQLRCTFLAVGHGACVVMELPGGEIMLYDAGSLGSPDRAAQTIASFLWSRGITHLDAVVLSHADVDHYNALPGLIKRFEIAKVYVSPLMFDPWITDGQLNAPNYLRQTLVDANIPLQEIWVNDRLRTADPNVAIEVLHPPRSGVEGRDNANSLLLAVRYQGSSILLPGDLESPGIEAVTAEPPQPFNILLAPHHGSRNSDPPGFAAWCTPKWVIVSGPRAGAEQQFTAQSYREVGAQVLHTASVGAVEFTLDERGVKYSQFLDDARSF